MVGTSALIPALRSITASRWTLLMARWFGQHHEFRDGNAWVKVAYWRGISYLIDASE